MLEILLLMIVAGIVAIAPTIHYLHMGGYDMHNIYKLMHK